MSDSAGAFGHPGQFFGAPPPPGQFGPPGMAQSGLPRGPPPQMRQGPPFGGFRGLQPGLPTDHDAQFDPRGNARMRMRKFSLFLFFVGPLWQIMFMNISFTLHIEIVTQSGRSTV